MNTFDAVVIGAGVGGLVAAACMLNQGLDVLVVERSPHPGGTANVFSRKGCTFPMGPTGFSSPQLVKKVLARIGCKEELELTRVHYRVRAFSMDVPLSLDPPEEKQELAKLFPGDADGIASFFEHTGRIAQAMQDPEDAGSGALLEEAARTPASQYLARITNEPRLRRILGSLGTQEPYAGLPLLAATWDLMSAQGIWYPRGGMAHFCKMLAQAVTGQAPEREQRIMHVAAAGIKTGNGKVLGACLADGAEIHAPVVVSNADYRSTFASLLSPGQAPGNVYEKVMKAPLTGSNIQVSLGLDTKSADLSAFDQAGRIIYRREGAAKAPEWSGKQVNPQDLAGQELELCLWSRDDPSLAPPGKAVLVIRTEALHSHFARYRPAPGRRSAEYHLYKMELAKALVDEAEKVVPGLAGAVQVVDVATPLTFEERAGRSEGAVAGWSWDYQSGQDLSPREMVRTPLEGLYMAGYQAYSPLFMGGAPTAMLSGIRAAEAALQGLGPADLDMPGAK